MKTLTRLLIAIFVFSNSLLFSQGITNGGFEKGKANWIGMNSNSDFTIVKDIKTEGDSAARVFKSGQNFIGIKNDVTNYVIASGPGTYHLKAYHYYGNGFGDNGKIDIRIEYKEDGVAKNKYIFGTQTAKLEGTDKWVMNEGDGLLSYTGVLTEVYIVAYTYSGSGTAPFYIDGVEFYKKGLNQYTITATAGANGKIEPSGTVTVNENDTKNFKITPNNGYEIDRLKIDGVAVADTDSYSFASVKANHTIDVTFKTTVSQTIAELKANYSGEVTWDKSTATVRFTKTGKINFTNKTDNKFFIWQVPDSVKKIIIAPNVTVTGAFHFYDKCFIAGEDRKTSIVYGIDTPGWASANLGGLEYNYCTFQLWGGSLSIQNLTSKNSYSYNIRGWGYPIYVKSCDFIDNRSGSGNHSDGFEGGNGSTIDDCYFECGDDVIKVYFDVTVTNTTIKMIQNSVPIQMGWGSYGSGAKGVFKNLTITGTEGRGISGSSYKRIIDAKAGQYNKELVFQNCSIDNPNGVLFTSEDARYYLDAFFSNTNINAQAFSTGSAFLGTADIYINGQYYNVKAETKSKWTVTGSADVTAPVITTFKSLKSTVALGDTITLQATITDNLNQVYRVDLISGGKVVAKDRLAPFEFKIVAAASGDQVYSIIAYDGNLNTATSNNVTVTVTGSSKSLPYSGKPFVLPGKIEAENFDIGGEGIAYHDGDAGRAGGDLVFRASDAPDVEFGPWSNPSGGFAIAYISSNEWYKYSINAPFNGKFKVTIGYCSPGDGNVIQFRLDDVVVDSLVLNKTADVWNVWAESTNSISMNINKGDHVLTLFIKKSGYNLDYANFTTLTGIENSNIPTEFALSQNYPNPFNPSTVISYSLDKREYVTLKIYDMLGREVRTLVNQFMEPGKYKAEFNAAGFSTGVYFYNLKSDTKNITKKMMLIK